MRPEAARARLERFAAHAAVVFGSGLEALPPGAEVVDEIAYTDLGWPCTAVPGHANMVRLVEGVEAAGARLRLALACGRPHLYEGWPDEELARPVRELVAAGVGRVVLTNSTGSLRPEAAPGDVVVCRDVVDLQRPPRGAGPPLLGVCDAAAAAAVSAALRETGGCGREMPDTQSGWTAGTGGVHAGTYVAVAGPQFETRAEVRWLAGYGDVVGMSAAPEVRAARAAGADGLLLALVANRAAEVGSHEEVLACGAEAARGLSAGLGAAVAARWPGLA